MSLLGAQLEAFAAVFEKGTVQGAAQGLGITQTGVTQRIRTLEAQLEVTLFNRSRRGMSPTTEALALYRYCRACREQEGALRAELSGAGKEAVRVVRVVGPSSVLRARVIPRMSEALEGFPKLRLHFELVDTETPVGRLRRGQADLAVLPRGDVTLELDSRLLKPEKYILVGPTRWKGRRIDEILKSESIVDFDPGDEMTFTFLRKFNYFEKASKDRHFVNNTDALASMVEAGVGYSVLARDYAASFIKSSRLYDLCPGKSFDYEVALAWYPRAEMPHYFETLLKSVR